jgi:RNA polymerase sigma-70 factor (ECF subfamily)
MDGSDEAAVVQAKAGDREAFRRLVERHARNVFRLSYRLTGNEEDAEDVVQETFLKAYRALDSFDERAQFGSWLYRIASNCALDLLRSRKRRATSGAGDELLETVPSRDVSPEASTLGSELGRRMAAALTRLSRHERTALVLRHFEGRPVAEIAGTLGISDGAARNTIFRAVAKLREALGTS